MKTKAFFLGWIIILFIACSQDSETPFNHKYSISGVAQKGPFIKGSTVKIFELTEAISQTGKSFTSELKTDLGEFEISDLPLESTKVEIIADGYYYNEVQGNLSQSKLTLNSLSDVSINESVNVNIMTHIIIDRLKSLMEAGNDYATAKEQAQNELLAQFQIDTDLIDDFENLDISKQESQNGILMALSALFQGQNSVAELSKLLADFKEDFGDNGSIDNESILFELLFNANSLDITSLRNNVENYYSSLGLDVQVPNFDQHITNFMDNVDFEQSFEMVYPSSGDYGDNLLAVQDSAMVTQGKKYSLAAIFPPTTELREQLKLETIEGDVTWEFNGSEQTSWEIGPVSIEQVLNNIIASLVGEKADMSIVFSGTGKVIIQVETIRLGVVDGYLGTKQIALTVE